MPGRLGGKIALISGGATGMGGASSKLFAGEGAKVGVVDLNEEAGHAVVAEIEAAGGTAVFALADVANEAQVNAAVTAITAALGAPNVLFNHAGSIVIKPFLETTLADWEWLMAVNVTSMFLVTKAVLPGMIAAGGVDRLHIVDLGHRRDAEGGRLQYVEGRLPHVRSLDRG